MIIQDISQSMNEILTTIISSIVTLGPRIFWAMMVAGIGWLGAWFLKKLSLHIIHGLDQLLERIAAQKGVRQVQIKQPLEKFIGETVFWISLIFFLILAVQILQLSFLSTLLEGLMHNLPMFALGIMIIAVSFLIGSICRQIVTTAFQAMEIDKAELFGNSIKILIIIIGVLLGIAQVGIDISFLTTVLSISIAAILGAIALAFGMGAQSYVANIISSVQIRKIYQNGDFVMIDSMKGKIIEITSTMIILQSNEGQLTVPAKSFLDNQSLLIDQEENNEA